MNKNIQATTSLTITGTLRLQCGCGKLHESRFPAGVSEAVQHGPNIRALAVHLTQGQLLPLARSAQLIGDLYGLEVSPATLLAWIEEASQVLQPAVESIAQALIKAPVVHADESGLRVASLPALVAYGCQRNAHMVRRACQARDRGNRSAWNVTQADGHSRA